MLPCSSDNLNRIDDFAQHIFALYTSELSCRTGATQQDIPLNEQGPSNVLPHRCEDLCQTIVETLVSAYLNPGT